MTRINTDESIFNHFHWYNEPDDYYFDNGLVIKTKPDTDFWQRTHYGFRRDNGHCLLKKQDGDFTFSANLTFNPVNKYDQCGIMIRLDKENWIKVSTEFENKKISRLGSVVTNLGYSDWATTDISSDIGSMWYRISKRGKDFLLENSVDGVEWIQMRITHLHRDFDEIEVGIYACSPMEGSFKCKISEMLFDENRWK